MVTTARQAQCAECDVPVTLTTKGKISAYRRSGRAYCSDEHRDAWVARDRSARMARTNRTHASARMTASNPMSDPVSRAAMTATLKTIGHKPQAQGGNGRGPTAPQKTLADLLGWPMEVIVPTGQRASGGPPSHYKLDLAHPAAKVAVEIDGRSHRAAARRESDRRKDQWLTAAGWTVLRFTNEEITADTPACARLCAKLTEEKNR